eukprot:1324922-Rhodomonas_salina.1
MSGTDLAYPAAPTQNSQPRKPPARGQLRTSLRESYAMPSTDIPYGRPTHPIEVCAIGRRTCYAVPGTDIGYRGIREVGWTQCLQPSATSELANGRSLRWVIDCVGWSIGLTDHGRSVRWMRVGCVDISVGCLVRSKRGTALLLD